MRTLSVHSQPVDIRPITEIDDALNELTGLAHALDTLLLHGDRHGMNAQDITSACLVSHHVGMALNQVAEDLRVLLDHVHVSEDVGGAS